MSTLRQDRTTGAWVIVAPERGLRPRDAVRSKGGENHARPFDPACPFCPGNEAKLPGILAELESSRPPGWQLRVIPNKYAVALPETVPARQVEAGHVTLASHGYCEVVVESPRHDDDLVSMSDDDIRLLVSLYRRRFSELMAKPGITSVTLFRNRGQASGASLTHPHSQFIALGMTPPRLLSMATWARQCGEETGRCVTCAELEVEIADGSRIIEETPLFVALAPFAATVPLEIWLVPRRHQASFAQLDDAECAEMGPLLRNTLRRLSSAHDDPPYNFVVDSFDAADETVSFAHWRLQIVPGLATWGGFELGTGIPINPSSPESDARILRAAATRIDAGAWPLRRRSPLDFQERS
jgi:UDPglucose--hexose-1-phosphate uridylyltransferase